MVAARVPRLLADRDRFVLEEAEASPTDVSPDNPDVEKRKFDIPVRIEANDLLFSVRSDHLEAARDVVAWLAGGDRLGGRTVASPRLGRLMAFDQPRVMFTQRGMPRRIADRTSLSFAGRVHPQSPMWMGFADQQASGSGPPQITTFEGNPSARFTDARAGDYFDKGSIQHLSHVILDLEQFYLAVAPTRRRTRPTWSACSTCSGPRPRRRAASKTS